MPNCIRALYTIRRDDMSLFGRDRQQFVRMWFCGQWWDVVLQDVPSFIIKGATYDRPGVREDRGTAKELFKNRDRDRTRSW
jgi:hypothetical protein